MNLMSRLVIGACGLLAAGAVMDGVLGSKMMQPAAAIIGRPATPVSVAGATRRTTRRVIRRSTLYYPRLPVGYTTVVVEGTSLYYYNGTYYQSDGNQYVVVYVD